LLTGRRLHITGVVQGVGFRPHVFALASRGMLAGWVRNSSSGVDIVVEGPPDAVEAFVDDLRAGGPPLARIDAIAVEEQSPEGHSSFTILSSLEEPGAYLPVSPDMATCPDCLREMRDPADRRYRYPFINCTNCGPRFTIVRDIPYDRPKTTMSGFPMCPECAAEYANPLDRRFHAQPIACPACGPRIRLERDGAATVWDEAAMAETRARLAAGEIVAVKGLGGFHLACDASNERAVHTLRQRKHREGKPFALMANDVATVARHALVTPAARALLESPERPVLLLPRAQASFLAGDIAPARNRLGFMLPYTPLHHLLLEPADGYPEVLVMTSGNLSDEPIAYEEEDARRRLGGIADAYLLHDRPIHMRCDDGVAAEFRGKVTFGRRSRGVAPLPVRLPFSTTPLLAVGGELKNVFCLCRDDRAFLSHHIGDLETLETLRSFTSGIEHFERLFRIRPEAVVHDLHPDYQATRYALARAASEGIPAIAVQHHHAHAAACMADHGLPEDARVIGVCFDGTGYGSDGAIWGGEFLVAGYRDFERALHLSYVPLPGGDAAIRKPYRAALSWLRQAGVPWAEDLAPVQATQARELAVLDAQLAQGLNAPPTSSMGRLFDAVAAIAGFSPRISYEGQAACELEAAASPTEPGAYVFDIGESTIDAAPVLRAVVADIRRGVPVELIAARFHNGVAATVVAACQRLREATGLNQIALSGGVWQNLLLLERTVQGLEGAGFRVLVHHQVPANDGGLSLGQAAVAAARLRRT
jgi:hydrogenase maturation protein HypF